MPNHLPQAVVHPLFLAQRAQHGGSVSNHQQAGQGQGRRPKPCRKGGRGRHAPFSRANAQRNRQHGGYNQPDAGGNQPGN